MKNSSNHWREAEEFLLKDKYIGPLIKKWGHCDITPRKKSDYFSSLVREIIRQQLSGASAFAIRERFEKKVKDKITPENVLKLSEQELRDCGMAWSKARYVRNLAQKVKENIVEIDKLDKLSDKEVIRELVLVKGIGRWTAEMFLMFSLARPDIFPVDDLGIRKAMARLRLKNSDRWKPYRTAASWYLWRGLENH